VHNVQVENTRNFAIIGHSGDGKTTLGESLLHRAGVTETVGSVDDGSSLLNYLPEERDGHIASVSSHIFGFDYSDKHMTLVDTPGDPNFQGDGQIALQALDGAILLVSAVDGAKAGTAKMLRAADRADMPLVAFVNGLDRPDSNIDQALASLSELDVTPALVALPVRGSDGLEGVIDLAHMKLLTNDGEREIPADFLVEASQRNEALVEAVAETNDELLEKYLEEGELGAEDLARGLSAAVKAKQILPVLCGSALTEVGVDLLLQDLVDLLPSPAERGEWSGSDLVSDNPKSIKPESESPFSAVVFKTIVDRYAGTLSTFRVVSGTVKADSHIVNATTGEKLRVSKLMLLQGEKHVDVSEAGPGDVVAVPKLKDVHTGNVLTEEKGGIHLAELKLPEGVISYAIESGGGRDDEKVFTALHKLAEEDPTLKVGREESTGEFLLTGMGELHIRTAMKKLKRIYDVELHLTTPKVPYRETIGASASNVEGKLKKQTGGAGMYGVCYIDIEPLPRGDGFAFEDKVVGGAIPRGLIPAVHKGVREACKQGPLAGFPVVDVKVTCIDGKYHAVDSNEMAFHLAGSFALKAAVQAAKPIILEPFMVAEVLVPEEHVGDVMGDLSSRRGMVQSTEARSHGATIVAKVPMSEMLDYATILTSMTGGKGEFHLEYSHYSEVPARLVEKIIEKEAEAK
jgi:elongation factor G